MTQTVEAPEGVEEESEDDTIVHLTCGASERSVSRVPLLAFCGKDVTLHEMAATSPTERLCRACEVAAPTHRQCREGWCEVWRD